MSSPERGVPRGRRKGGVQRCSIRISPFSGSRLSEFINANWSARGTRTKFSRTNEFDGVNCENVSGMLRERRSNGFHSRDN